MIRKAWILVIAAMAPLAAWAELPATQPAPATQPGPATQPAPETQPTPEVLALIEQMGAGNFQSRTRAENELVNRGAPVEPALKHAASDSPSAEIRDRAAIAVTQIEQNIADAPTFITLHVKNAPGQDVVKELSRQAKVRVVLSNAQRPGSITLDLDHVPFWTAIEALCKVTHTHPQIVGQSGEVSLTAGPMGPWDQRGRFAFMPTMIDHDSQMDLINGGANKNDSIGLEVFLDPRIHSVDWDAPHIDVAEDEKGHSLLPAPGAMVNFGYFYHQGFQQQWAIDLQSPLAFPAMYGHTLTRLEGTLTMRFPREVETLKIPDVTQATGTVAVAGNHRVDVIACSFNGKDALIVHFRISRLARAAAMNNLPGGLFQEFQAARIVDANGHQLTPNGGGAGTDIQIDWHGSFIANGQLLKPPFSLQWDTVKSVESVTIPFKFKNLPLPPQ